MRHVRAYSPKHAFQVSVGGKKKAAGGSPWLRPLPARCHRHIDAQPANIVGTQGRRQHASFLILAAPPRATPNPQHRISVIPEAPDVQKSAPLYLWPVMPQIMARPGLR
ncbi:hypothetical protein CEXT_31561 [Caerostris extrusa]|uniref:Uncharacterized protein n=1 Tax=Caerostris extrusa TaxID=172846 RepID=A0AAV4UEP0_CAEEX|nr:hypothetical protein CEXT_31561 [Caerostris extrusa]